MKRIIHLWNDDVTETLCGDVGPNNPAPVASVRPGQVAELCQGCSLVIWGNHRD